MAASDDEVERLTRELTARDEEQHSLDIRIGQLQNERDTACKHFEQLKDALTGLKQEVDKLHRQNAQERQQKVELQRKYEGQKNHLKEQLESQARDFEETRKRLVPPKDFEMLRIRLIEELEVPYQNRFQQLHQELELSREQFYAQRRETALLREEYENAAAIHIKDMEGQRDEYEMRCDDLRNRVRSMQAMIEDTNQQDQNASLQRESAELKANIKSLLAELEDVRTIKEHAVVDRERQAASHAKALSEEVVAARILATEKDSVERRCRSLEQQISQLTGNDTAERQMQRLQDENQMHRNTREEMENAIQAERNTFNAKLLEREREMARISVELQAELDSVRKRNDEMKEDLVKAERSFQNQRQQIVDDFESERAQMEHVSDAQSRELEERSVALTNTQISKAESLSEASKQVDQLEETLATANRAITDLEVELRDRKDAHLESTARIEELMSSQENFISQCTKLEGEKTDLTVAAERLLEEGSVLREAKHNIESKVASRKTRQSKERAGYEKKLTQYKDTLEKEHASLKAAVAQGEKNKQKFKKEVKSMRGQISVLMSQLDGSDRKSINAAAFPSNTFAGGRGGSAMAGLNDSGGFANGHDD